MKESMVSVIVPVHNTSQYLAECLESIISQDYSKLQIIIINDGSTDDSAEICNKYAEIDRRIEVIHTENCGSVKARKIGLMRAKGDYVGFVDSDDYIENSMYSLLVYEMERTGVDFVHSGYKEICGDKVNSVIGFDKHVYEFNDLKGKCDFLDSYLMNLECEKKISYSMWSKLFRKDLAIKCFNLLDDSLMLGEDVAFFFRCIFESSSISLLPEAHYNYRVLKSSLSHGRPENIFPGQVLFCSEVIKILNHYGYMDEKRIYSYLKSTLLPTLKNDVHRVFDLSQFYYDNVEKYKGKAVVIYGAGNVGQDIYRQLIARNIDVLCVVDKNQNRKMYDGRKVVSPNEITQYSYDLILIALYRENIASEVRCDLMEKGIESEKIQWICPKRFF